MSVTNFPAVPSLDQIRTWVLTDWQNADFDIDVTTDSDNYIKATGYSGAVLGLYQYARWGVNQAFPDTATLNYLTRFGSERGVIPKIATSANGTILFAGAPNSDVPLGTVAVYNGVQYQTTVDAPIGANGTAAIAAQAVVPGSTGNLTAGTIVTLQSPPAGVTATATVQSMGEGYDAETQADYLVRVLYQLRNPPAGGKASDFVIWALSLPGVNFAIPYPQRRGLGTIDVCIMTNGQPATIALMQTVTAYVATVDPAGLDFRIVTPTLVPVNVVGQVAFDPTITDLATVNTQGLAATQGYFATLTAGVTCNRGMILAAILNVAGVTDLDLPTPAASVPMIVDPNNIQLASLGTFTLTQEAS